MRVAVLRGGRSSEHDVSLESGRAVADGLRAAGHDALVVDIARDGRWHHDGTELTLRPAGGLLDADVAFPVLHGPFGEDGTVQGALEILGVPYVGSGVAASAICIDKLLFKQLMAQTGVPQVAYAQATPDTAADVVGLPCWVKPARLGSSVGIARVDAPDQFAVAVAHAAEHDARVIVEAHAGGIEVECSVLGATGDATVSLPGEIVLRDGADWYDYEAKYTDGGMELVIPARISDTAAERVRAIAVEAFDQLRLQRPGSRRLLRRRRGRGAQRAQHDARADADERLREALGRERARLSRRSRTAVRDRGRAPRVRGAPALLRAISASAEAGRPRRA